MQTALVVTAVREQRITHDVSRITHRLRPSAPGWKRPPVDIRFRPTAALCAVREYRSKAEAIGG